MLHVKAFIKREMVFCVSFLAALVSCFFVKPDMGYLAYMDFRTLALLYCLMIVVAGFRGAGLFSFLAHRLCGKAKNARIMGIILVFLCFFSSMIITNDVALLTFVPFAVVVLGITHEEKELIHVVVLQTIAANLGSMLTPVGNPQNLYIFSHYSLGNAEFFSATLPVWLVSMLLVFVLCFTIRPEKITTDFGEEPDFSKGELPVYSALLAVCLLVVFRVLDWYWMLLFVIIALAVYDRRALKDADFVLLLTFVCFFVFSGNLARIPKVNSMLRAMLQGRTYIVSLLTSQVISNVPSALLLSGFTDEARQLLLGVNVGGLGTPIASLASLISLKLYSHAENSHTGKYLLYFTVLNVLLIIPLSIVANL